jgi:hypothetical protein
MFSFRNLPPLLPVACVAVILAYFIGTGPRAFAIGPIDLQASTRIVLWLKLSLGIAIVLGAAVDLIRRMIWGRPPKSERKSESPVLSLAEANVERNLAELHQAPVELSPKPEGFSIATAASSAPIKVDVAEGRVIVRATAEQLTEFKRAHPRPAPRASVPSIGHPRMSGAV